ncbi:MAG: ribosome maturation factor RimM [Acidobacteria bacterium]|nr:MAG: ribosome maturation factor RimM [Acidobacteriota bacterium]
MSEWDDMAVVGRIARAHGNRGQVIVDPATDFPEERFKAGSVLHIQREGAIESLTVENVRFHRGRPIVGLAGIDTMDGAEAMAGIELRVSAEALQPLPPGSFYHHDLVDCAVETPRGELIGRVTAVEGDAAGSRLIVRGRNGEVLIPLAEGICVAVDVPGKKIVVEPPEGLLDLNVTKRQRF